jgi:hypothetical protein
VKFKNMVRGGVAAALIASVPVSATVAATRPNAAVPMAGAQAVTSQYDASGNASMPWLPLAAIGVALVVAIIIVAGSNGGGNGALSRG